MDRKDVIACKKSRVDFVPNLSMNISQENNLQRTYILEKEICYYQVVTDLMMSMCFNAFLFVFPNITNAVRWFLKKNAHSNVFVLISGLFFFFLHNLHLLNKPNFGKMILF